MTTPTKEPTRQEMIEWCNEALENELGVGDDYAMIVAIRRALTERDTINTELVKSTASIVEMAEKDRAKLAKSVQLVRELVEALDLIRDAAYPPTVDNLRDVVLSIAAPAIAKAKQALGDV